MRHAFLIDDNAEMREVLTACLENAHWSVLGVAETESEAKDWLSRRIGEVELVVLDLFLSKGNGVGILAFLKGLPHNNVVVLTNYDSGLLRKNCLSLGAGAVFDKSTEMELFISYCAGLP